MTYCRQIRDQNKNTCINGIKEKHKAVENGCQDFQLNKLQVLTISGNGMEGSSNPLFWREFVTRAIENLSPSVHMPVKLVNNRSFKIDS